MNGRIRPVLASLIAPLLTAVLYFVVAVATLRFAGARDGVTALWPANALLLAAIIGLPGQRRLPFLLLGALANAAANLLVQLPAVAVFGFTAANMAEVAIAALLFDRLCPERHLVTSLRHLGAFSIMAILSSATSATIAAMVSANTVADMGRFWVSWFTADTLGMLVVVPPALMFLASPRRDPEIWRRRSSIEMAAILAGVVAVNLAVFALPPYPLTFLPLAALLFATARLGPLGAPLSLLITATVGTLMTAAGKGPLAAIPDTAETALLFQIYLAVLFATSLPITSLLAGQRQRIVETDRSDRFHRSIIDRTHALFFETDAAGRWTFLSPAWEELTGKTVAQAIGAPVEEIIHPDDFPKVLGMIETLYAKEGGEDSIDTRYRAADGDWRWATVRATRLADKADVFTGVFGTMIDINDRFTAERARARLGENYRLLTLTEAMAHIGHWRFDMATRDLFLSEEMRRIHGLPLDTPVTLEDTLATMHPDDRATVAAALDAGQPYERMVRVIWPGGEIRHTATQGQPERAPDGTVLAMSGFVQDITDRSRAEAKLRESEAQYRLLAEHASDIIFRLDAEGRYLYISPSSETLTGFAPEELIGQKPSDHAHAEDRSKVRETLRALHEAKGGQCIVSYRRQRKDGSWQWLEANARLTLAEDGSTEIVGIARDISDRKRFEAELLRAREAAERAAQEARQIAATDELTGLASRRMFMGRLVGEVTAAAMTETPLSVALLDVDHFKLVNDHYGHAVGDRVLQAIATTASRALRGHDVIGRIGGEEFAVLMPRTTAEAAALVGERLRHAVETSGEEHPELPRVTVSIGIACLGDGGDAASLLAAADYALYTAKAEGRNLLRLAS